MRAAVIGAGYSGLMLSRALARVGANVDLYEEHDRVGFPEHCTGLVSSLTVRLIGPPAEGSRLGEIGSFVISGPTSSVRLRPSEPVVKLDRVRLEEMLLDDAVREGVKYYSESRVRVSPAGEVLPSGRRYDVVVLAEGYLGRLRRALGVGFAGPPVYGVNAEVDDRGNPDFVARFDGETSYGFFSWRVTLGSYSIVGTASKDPRLLGRLLKSSLERHNVEGRPFKVYGGPIIVGPPPRSVAVGRVVVVGDAAAMNKPLTGGGLYPTALASHALEVMAANGLAPEEAVRRSVLLALREVSRSYHVSRVLHDRPALVDALAAAASRYGIADDLSGSIDYDRHYLLLRRSISMTKAVPASLQVLVQDPYGAARLLASLLEDML